MLALFLALTLAAAEPAAAPESPDAAPTAAAQVGGPTVKTSREGGDRLVCKRQAKANSRFTTKVCKTVDEWDDQAETARQAFADEQQRPMVNIGKGN